MYVDIYIYTIYGSQSDGTCDVDVDFCWAGMRFTGNFTILWSGYKIWLPGFVQKLGIPQKY